MNVGPIVCETALLRVESRSSLGEIGIVEENFEIEGWYLQSLKGREGCNIICYLENIMELLISFILLKFIN